MRVVTRVSLPGLAAALVATAVVVPYGVFWPGDTANETPRILVVIACVGAAAVLAAAGSVASAGAEQSAFLGTAAGLLGAWGILGIFSIGLPLLLASGLALAGVRRLDGPTLVGAFALGIGLALGGVSLT